MRVLDWQYSSCIEVFEVDNKSTSKLNEKLKIIKATRTINERTTNELFACIYAWDFIFYETDNLLDRKKKFIQDRCVMVVRLYKMS